ncbi:MAG: hypothetical protein CSB48_00035 [Proteobacteria bacterium]|nr:MAG: hypothetical protein CSB48_00035 [Pseudomonadota bacterium]
MRKILLVIFIFLFSACDVQKSEPEIPDKPVQVPDKAFWVGGLDGGVFVLVERSESVEANEYLGELYYISGDLAYRGKLNILPKDSAVIDYKNPEIYQGWDGDTLYLAGSRQLKVPE